MSCHTVHTHEQDFYDITTAAAAAEAEILEAAGHATEKTKAKTGAVGRNTDSFYPPVDVFAAPSHWTLLVAVPGVKKENVSVCWDARSSTLAIGGHAGTPGHEEKEMGRMVFGEGKAGAFERQIRLPPGEDDEGVVDGESITSRVEDGVLTVMVPKRKAGE
ncbi:hypothetical protein C8A03DRAFT_29436 [Achaetomium macrosporum]|uniref:SHSP domain-containing protein n=1 Tax=Achaetomium macrosporum TaxID=79813 RepID=A0AAN7HEM5_9PEZI|nr:hypothetical protein C8A03DRAFT_29436 [Achaetomium macrosporum]